MPLISLAMLVGLMAMAALPPLNGFAGEWVIYQSFFQNEHWRPVYRPFAGAATGRWPGDHWRTGGDVYGESLRRDLPRRAADERGGKRHLRPWLMTLSVVLAAVFCLVGGIAAPWLLPLVSGAFPVQAQVSSVVSQPMIARCLSPARCCRSC